METELLRRESVRVRQGIVGGCGEGRWEGVVRVGGRVWRGKMGGCGERVGGHGEGYTVGSE